LRLGELEPMTVSDVVPVIRRNARDRRPRSKRTMELIVSLEIWRKGGWHLARCPELDLVSQGSDADEARRNLLEVVGIQLEEMAEQRTLDAYLAECGSVPDLAGSMPQVELISVEKQPVQLVKEPARCHSKDA
jgi:predicted RNase H-like HicB family nuclease